MENNLAFVLKKPRRGEKKEFHSKVQLSVEYSSLPPFSKQAGALDAYVPGNSGIMKWHERKAMGH